MIVKSVALAAALAGGARAQPACQPAYVPGARYVAGNRVSVASTNYQCRAGPFSAFCAQSGFAPGGLYGPFTWDSQGACTTAVPATPPPTNAPTPPPSPARWSGGGCPAEYSAGTAYEPGDVVSRIQGSFTVVYECAEAPNNRFCGQAGFEPGVGTAWEQAWTALGSCVGTLSPTPGPTTGTPTNSPSPPIWSEGACPAEYVAGTAYEPGDVVSRSQGSFTVVYECAAAPDNQFCGQTGYEPGEGIAWEQAWTALGSCIGTFAPTVAATTGAPTTSPSPPIWSGGACPAEYLAGTAYEPGDVVSRSQGSFTVVYECAAAPDNLFCGQAGYEPGDGIAWEQAWTALGSCVGTFAPTVAATTGAPTTSPSPPIWSGGACPAEYSAGTAYEPGDVVSRSQGSFTVVYECAAAPDNLFCGQAGYEPGEGIAWEQAWTALGSCIGTFAPTVAATTGAPTSSPSPPIWSGGACPAEFSAGTAYEPGDVVSRSQGSFTVVYECAAAPDNLFCGQAGYEPGDGIAWEQAWTALGSCVGTFAPTVAATTGAPTTSPSPPIWSGGACPAEFSAGATYEPGDVVSRSQGSFTVVYECAAAPDNLFCGQAGYEPGEGIAWEQAWTALGSCTGTFAPTVAATTGAPTTSPSPPIWSGGACPAEFSAGTAYEPGDVVSRSQGSFTVVYECAAAPDNLFCGQAGYEPGDGIAWEQAWTALGSCIGTFAPTPQAAPTTSPSPPVWSGGACPAEYSAGAAYEPGEVVSRSQGSFAIVYECAAAPDNLFCGQAGYEPGEGIAWEQAWTALGSCIGTFAPTVAATTGAPTKSPSPPIWSGGGCPAEFSAGATYEPGEVVSRSQGASSVVYECAEAPNNRFCGQAGFEPGDGIAWEMAWTVLGTCTGTFAPTVAATTGAPTKSPSLPVWSEGGCPAEYSAGTAYEPGDVVSRSQGASSLVYECTEAPNNQFCGMTGFEPGEGVGWEHAWAVLGSCTGTLAPTVAATTGAPTKSPSPPVWSRGGCPAEYSAGTAYEPGDVVSVTQGSFAIVYECAGAPVNQFCGMTGFEPGEGIAWEQAWTALGSCTGTLAPTGAPTDAPPPPAWSGGVCPAAYSAGTAYEPGDFVSVSQGTFAIVYACAGAPVNQFCGMAGFEPGEGIGWEQAWTALGSCTGTLVAAVHVTKPHSAPNNLF